MSKIQKAIKSGHIDLGFGKIPVAVLKDGTRLITASGFHKALGKPAPAGGRNKEGTANLPSFLRTKVLKSLVTNDLLSILSPAPFFMPTGAKAIGYPAQSLPKVCEVFLKARDMNLLDARQLQQAACADLIMRALAHIGIISLIDEATGYQEIRDKVALQAILDKYLSKEAAKWAKTFPDSFYLNIFRLKGWNQDKGLKSKPWALASITKDLVYKRMAPELLDALEEKNPVLENGKRIATHHQFLTRDQGLLHLKFHLMVIERVMKSCNNWDEFITKMNSLFPYSTFDETIIDTPEPQSPE